MRTSLRRRVSAVFGFSVSAIALLCLAADGQERLPTNAPPPPVTITAHPITANVTVTDQQMLNADKDGDNWLLHGRTYDSQSFSPLKQISAANVASLKPVALIQTGFNVSMENTPIEVNGILYVVTAQNHVMAYDAVTGETLWAYNPVLDPMDSICCGPQAKGVAVAYGKVFVPLLDGRMVALDARSGAVVWLAKQADILPTPTHYYTFTSAPQVFDGMVLVGNAGSEYPTRGFVEALSADSGKLLWRFNTTAAPDEPGGGPQAWGGESWKVGGGSVWNTPAIDAKNGLAIFAVANPNPDYQGEERPGTNLYTNSIVAVDVHTGKIKWWQQEVPHDLWDYDAVAPVALFDAIIDGKRVPAAAEGGKVGFVFVVNRLTGELLHKTAFVKMSANMFDKPGPQPIIRYPGINGGSLWSTPAFSPLTHDFYIMGVNEAYSIQTRPLQPLDPPPKGQRTGGGQRQAPEAMKPSGNLTAINVDSGKIAWQVETKLPMYGGVIATASNLVFTGEVTGDVDAFDARSGKKLWHYYMGAGVCTPPITYRVKSVQYLAVGAGGCARGREYVTAEGRQQYGDVIAIFALPGKD